MIGFLSPTAEFHKCPSWSHTHTARKLCEQFNIPFDNCIDAEKQLLARGWVVFTARSAYYDYYKEIETPILTDKVIDFLRSNIGTYNNQDQENAVKDILESRTLFGRCRAKALARGADDGREPN